MTRQGTTTGEESDPPSDGEGMHFQRQHTIRESPSKGTGHGDSMFFRHTDTKTNMIPRRLSQTEPVSPAKSPIDISSSSSTKKTHSFSLATSHSVSNQAPAQQRAKQVETFRLARAVNTTGFLSDEEFRDLIAEPETQCTICNPRQKRRKILSLLVALGAFFDAFARPLQIVVWDWNEKTDTGAKIVLVFTYCIFFVYSIDIICNFQTMYIARTKRSMAVMSSGGWVSKRSYMARHYLCTWFVPDLLATLPWDNIFPDYKWLVLLRMIRLVKVMRWNLMWLWITQYSVIIGPFMKLAIQALAGILATHWCACIFVLFGVDGCLTIADPPTTNGARPFPGIPNCWSSNVYYENDRPALYVVALQWALSNLVGRHGRHRR